MSANIDSLLGDIWRRAGGGQPETCIELALLRVLQSEDGWLLLRDRLKVAGVPKAVPTVTRQDSTENGRSDLKLSWSERSRPVVLELKVWDPPSSEQVDQYLADQSDVVGIAAYPGSTVPRELNGATFFGVVSWAGVTYLGAGKTKELEQLRGLCEEIGVVGGRIDEAALLGMVASWDVWESLAKPIWSAASETSSIWSKVDSNWTHKNSKKPAISKAWGRYQHWLWNQPLGSSDVEAWAYTGIQGKGSVDGVGPDLVLAIQLAPAHPCREIRELNEALGVWKNDQSTSRQIQSDFSNQSWVLAQVRTPAIPLLTSARDQGHALVSWIEMQARDLVKQGVIGQLAIGLESGIALGPE